MMIAASHGPGPGRPLLLLLSHTRARPSIAMRREASFITLWARNGRGEGEDPLWQRFDGPLVSCVCCLCVRSSSCALVSADIATAPLLVCQSLHEFEWPGLVYLRLQKEMLLGTEDVAESFPLLSNLSDQIFFFPLFHSVSTKARTLARNMEIRERMVPLFFLLLANLWILVGCSSLSLFSVSRTWG